MAVVEVEALPIGLRDVQAILGRDLLNLGLFVYDGLAGKYSFTLPD